MVSNLVKRKFNPIADCRMRDVACIETPFSAEVCPGWHWLKPSVVHSRMIAKPTAAPRGPNFVCGIPHFLKWLGNGHRRRSLQEFVELVGSHEEFLSEFAHDVLSLPRNWLSFGPRNR